ncbi:SAM-dependent methyltransferase [Epidermidibacterium keratini]|uniref:SAM-dependent methyltransferase n=1 Tax=Epidermidibacterium keratini TaxID=1891644 RepID=A0A7L4YLB4_9ACTN|nr:class I SAM-dependent methyltransferase [Epidermidibacterium keratini]QHC00051.1 SAM-dependent methyltransferase [Epidermidibacterium keratini]
MSTPDWDAVYAAAEDPFEVATSWYERRKMDVVLASLAQERYRLIWDCASGTGHLAARLAGRGPVIASDAAQAAVELTAKQLETTDGQAVRSPLPHVPELAADAELVVVSEVLYYLDRADRRAVADGIDQTTAREVIAVHWRHSPHDAHIAGDVANDEFGAHLHTYGWRTSLTHEDADFVLHGWKRGIGR